MGSTGEATDQDMIAPPSTPDFSGEVDLNLAWLLLVVVVRLHVEDLHAVGWLLLVVVVRLHVEDLHAVGWGEHW